MEQDKYNDLVNELVDQTMAELDDQIRFIRDGMKENLLTIFHDKMKHLMEKQ